MLTMKYLTLKTRLLALLLLAATCAAAQPTPAQLASRPELTASIYHSYEYLPGPAAPVPDGYEPFYISHYGPLGKKTMPMWSISMVSAAINCMNCRCSLPIIPGT